MSNQKKTPTLLGFLRKPPKDLQTLLLQKQTKTKTRKRKRTTVQDNESDVFTNCVKTYKKTPNCHILEQRLFLSDGIKELPTDCTVTKINWKKSRKCRQQIYIKNLCWHHFFQSWRRISKSTCDYQHLRKCSHISYIAPILRNVLGYCKWYQWTFHIHSWHHLKCHHVLSALYCFIPQSLLIWRNWKRLFQKNVRL